MHTIQIKSLLDFEKEVATWEDWAKNTHGYEISMEDITKVKGLINTLKYQHYNFVNYKSDCAGYIKPTINVNCNLGEIVD